MPYELIITEKPQAAKKIAEALAEGKAIKESYKGVPYYNITRKNKDIMVACAVGHLFTVAEKEKKGMRYPVFDVNWQPTYEVSKGSDFTKKYYEAIKKLTKGAKEFTIATDFDIEGEVIGVNVLRHICRQQDGSRMKFSTLTKQDLVEAYDNKMKTLEWGQANAGLTRHELDWYYGINLSRALTGAIKSIGNFKIMSSGRVQGPALKIVVDREHEIKGFKSQPYWQIELDAETQKKETIVAWHKEDKFWVKENAEDVMKKIQGTKKAIIASVEKTQFEQQQPHPFDLTSLQTEAYRIFKIQPKDSLAIAQELYIAGSISYPRTSSQQLPKEIGFTKILSLLAKDERYKANAEKILAKKSLQPNNGKKTDPAHPAIYPTGIVPHVAGRQQKIYDLIVKRFMATFADVAVRETVNVAISCKEELFIAKGTRTIGQGWHVFYLPYVKLEEIELPKLEKGQSLDVRKIAKHEEQTLPPARYTPASIIKALEKKNLGTKATRAAIVETLYARNYVKGLSLEATELGIHTVDTLQKYCPKILDDKLTRHFEVEMDQIREKKKTNEQVLEEAQKVLTKILTVIKKNEKEIGKNLMEANIEAQNTINTVGKCPNCKDGMLMIRRGKFGRFIACDKYPDCKTTFKLPVNGMIEVSKEMCEHCQHPMIAIKRKRSSKQNICINLECKSKQIEDLKLRKEADNVESGKIDKKCPKCGSNLVLRKSIYGKFYGCSTFPKCRHIEKIEKKDSKNENKGDNI
jgi:DNA topoisomerase-1